MIGRPFCLFQKKGVNRVQQHPDGKTAAYREKYAVWHLGAQAAEQRLEQIQKKYAAPILAEHNVTLEIVEFDDYVMPNTAVEDGSLDANYFQHEPYLDDFNAEQGTHIVSVVTPHYEPMGIYPGKTADLSVFSK